MKITLTFFTEDNSNGGAMVLDQPTMIIAMNKLKEDEVYSVPAVQGKWHEGEIALKKRGDSLGIWTHHATNFNGANCMPSRAPSGGMVDRTYENLTTGQKVVVPHHHSLDSPINKDSSGWVFQSVHFWQCSGLARPLGYKRFVQLEME